jgi:tripartite-type tricarboxylate transporter receptor subunit TctC
MMSIRAIGAAFAGAATIAIGTAALAQDWPTHAITVVSPFANGTTYDLVAHLVLDQVAREIGQPFVVENRPGGDGAVGVVSVVNAEPDGYTLLLSSSAMSTAVILHKSLPYEPLRDLEPVAMFGGEPSILLAAPSKGYSTVGDLVAAAKANPGKLKFASVGLGSASQLAGERFRQVAGPDVQHIPYRRSSQRSNGWARRFLFRADSADAAFGRARQGSAARGEHDRALAATTRPADARGNGLFHFDISDLVRALGSSEYAARRRRQAERGN